MRFSFFKRLCAGFAVTMPLAYWLGTAPLNDLNPHADPPVQASLPAPHITLASAPAGSSGSFMSLEGAFQSDTSEVLWSDKLPLDRQSPDTVENVRLAADSINLAAVRPNETFSFNDTVGIRTEEKGYRPGLMYSSGEVVMGVGGGICIASTELYKAALESGMKIIERHPHSGPVSYADPGRDAAVSYGWADMRFKNNTGSLLLIRATVQDDELIVALYGKTKPGQTVEIASEDLAVIPYQVIEKEDVTIPEGQSTVQQKAHDGYAITTVRLIRQNGKLVSREIISHDTVPPRNKIVLVPPKHDSGPRFTLPFDIPGQTHSGSPLPLPLPATAAPAAPSLPASDRTAPSASE